MISINPFMKEWHPYAIEGLLERETDGEFIIIPSYSPCRHCGAKNRFVYSFKTMRDGRFMCMRICTFCGESYAHSKLKVNVDVAGVPKQLAL